MSSIMRNSLRSSVASALFAVSNGMKADFRSLRLGGTEARKSMGNFDVKVIKATRAISTVADTLHASTRPQTQNFSMSDFNRLIRHEDVMGAFSELMQARQTLKTLPSSMWSALLEKIALSRSPVMTKTTESTKQHSVGQGESLDFTPLTPNQSIDRAILFREVFEACISDTGVTWNHTQWSNVILATARSGDKGMVKVLLDYYTRVYPLVKSVSPMSHFEEHLNETRLASQRIREERLRASLLEQNSNDVENEDNSKVSVRTKIIEDLLRDPTAHSPSSSSSSSLNTWKDLTFGCIEKMAAVKFELAYLDMDSSRDPSYLMNAVASFENFVLTPVYDSDGNKQDIGAHSFPVTADQKQYLIIMQISFEALVRSSAFSEAIKLFEGVFKVCQNTLKQRNQDLVRLKQLNNSKLPLNSELKVEQTELQFATQSAHLRSYQYNIQKTIHKMHLRLMRHYFLRGNTEAMIEWLGLLQRFVEADRTGTIPLAASMAFNLIVTSFKRSGDLDKVKEWSELTRAHEAQILLAAASEKEHVTKKLAGDSSTLEVERRNKTNGHRRVRLYDPDSELSQRRIQSDLLGKANFKASSLDLRTSSDSALTLGRKRAAEKLEKQETWNMERSIERDAEAMGSTSDFDAVAKFLDRKLSDQRLPELNRSQAFLKLLKSLDRTASNFSDQFVDLSMSQESEVNAKIQTDPGQSTKLLESEFDDLVEKETEKMLAQLPFASANAATKVKHEVQKRLLREQQLQSKEKGNSTEKDYARNVSSNLIDPANVKPIPIGKGLTWSRFEPGHVLGLLHAAQLAGISLTSFHIAAAISLILRFPRTSLLGLKLLVDANRLGFIKGQDSDFKETQNGAQSEAQSKLLRGSSILYEVMFVSAAKKILSASISLKSQAKSHTISSGSFQMGSSTTQILIESGVGVSPFQLASAAAQQGVQLSPISIACLIQIAGTLGDWNLFYKFVEKGISQTASPTLASEEVQKARYQARLAAARVLSSHRFTAELVQMIREIEISEHVRILSSDVVDHYFPELNSRTPWGTVLTTSAEERRLCTDDFISESKQENSTISDSQQDLDSSLLAILAETAYEESEAREDLEKQKQFRLQNYGAKYSKWQSAQERLESKMNEELSTTRHKAGEFETHQSVEPDDSFSSLFSDSNDKLSSLSSANLLTKENYGRGVNVHLTGDSSMAGSTKQQSRAREHRENKEGKEYLPENDVLIKSLISHSNDEQDDELDKRKSSLEERLADLELRMDLAGPGLMGTKQGSSKKNLSDEENDDFRHGEGSLPEDLANERDAEEGEIEFIDNESDSDLDEDWSGSDVDYNEKSEVPDFDSLLESFGDPNYAKMYSQVAKNAPVKTIKELVVEQEKNRILLAAGRDPSLALASLAASNSVSGSSIYAKLSEVADADPIVRARIVAKHALDCAQKLSPWQRWKYNVWLIDKGLSLVQKNRLRSTLGNKALVELQNLLLSSLLNSKLDHTLSKVQSRKVPQLSQDLGLGSLLLFRSQRELMEVLGVAPNETTASLTMRASLRAVLSHSRRPFLAIEPTIRTLTVQPSMPLKGKQMKSYASDNDASIAAQTLNSVMHRRSVAWEDNPVMRFMNGYFGTGMQLMDKVVDESIARGLSPSPRTWLGIAQEALHSAMPFVALPFVLAALKSNIDTAVTAKSTSQFTQNAIDSSVIAPMLHRQDLKLSSLPSYSDQWVARGLSAVCNVNIAVQDTLKLQLSVISSIDHYLSLRCETSLHKAAFNKSPWAGQVAKKPFSQVGRSRNQLVSHKEEPQVALRGFGHDRDLDLPLPAFIPAGNHGMNRHVFRPIKMGEHILDIDPQTGVLSPILDASAHEIFKRASLSMRLATHQLESLLPIIAPAWNDPSHGRSWSVDTRLAPSAGSFGRFFVFSNPNKTSGRTRSSSTSAVHFRNELAPHLRDSIASYVRIIRKYLALHSIDETKQSSLNPLCCSDILSAIRLLAAVDHLDLIPVLASLLLSKSQKIELSASELNFIQSLRDAAMDIRVKVQSADASRFTMDPESSSISDSKKNVWITIFAKRLELEHTVATRHFRDGGGAYSETIVRLWLQKQDTLINSLQCLIDASDPSQFSTARASNAWSASVTEPFDWNLTASAVYRDYRSSSDPISRLTQKFSNVAL